MYGRTYIHGRLQGDQATQACGNILTACVCTLWRHTIYFCTPKTPSSGASRSHASGGCDTNTTARRSMWFIMTHCSFHCHSPRHHHPAVIETSSVTQTQKHQLGSIPTLPPSRPLPSSLSPSINNRAPSGSKPSPVTARFPPQAKRKRNHEEQLSWCTQEKKKDALQLVSQHPEPIQTSPFKTIATNW